MIHVLSCADKAEVDYWCEKDSKSRPRIEKHSEKFNLFVGVQILSMATPMVGNWANLRTSKQFAPYPTKSRVLNRVHERAILRDYGKPTPPSVLLTALEGWVDGRDSLCMVSLII